MWPTFFFADSVTNLRFHELCFSDILQWAWLKLPSLFLLQATQILNLGYLRATQVAWTGSSSQGSAVEAESLGLGTDKQAFPASYWSWSFSFFCCSQLPSSHSVLPPSSSFQMIWSSEMPLWDDVTDRTCAQTPGHVSLTSSNSGLTRKAWAKRRPLSLRHILMLPVSLWSWLHCLSYLPTLQWS